MKNKQKKKGNKRLDLSERIQIEIKYSQGLNLGEIAKHLGKGRNKSTISREIDGRPRKGFGKYQAYQANCRAVKREESRGKRDRLKNEDIRIYSQVNRGGNGKVKNGCEDLRPYLARRHTRRQKKGFRRAQKAERAILPSIDDRPKIVEKRKEIGHFEGDTIVSKESKPRLKTLNERSCGVVLIGKTKDGTTEECNRVALERLTEFPEEYRKTLTQDRGTENFDYKPLEETLGISCYFAHAYCSQERGSNENLNGLIRRYFPKGTDFSKVSDEEIMRVECLLNNRPRKRFGGLTPLEVLFMKTGVALKY
ncbi:MAG: IS30 family transposase [Patescibacteria group bacterium]